MNTLLNLIKETDFIGSDVAIIVLGTSIAVFAFFRFRKLLADWDPKKKKREHHKFRIASLEAMKSADSEEINDFIIRSSDTALIRSLKEQIWEAYDARYVFVDELGEDEVSRLRFPLTTVEAYARGRQALIAPTAKSNKVWSIKKASISLQRLSLTFLVGALICISFSLSGFFSLLIRELFSIEGEHFLDSILVPLLMLGAIFSAIGYTLMDNIKHVISAHKFKNLWVQRIDSSINE
ncbi:hypothetical protein [Idiomarina sp.]|uniref:hypothetical protein n=1 Tax=Idiomarina sp. TaxID=1874361 RepID=UPI003A910911